MAGKKSFQEPSAISHLLSSRYRPFAISSAFTGATTSQLPGIPLAELFVILLKYT